MAETLVSSILSAVFDKIGEKVDSQEVVDFIQARKLDQKVFQKIIRKLRLVETVTSDAEEMQIRSRSVKEWLDEWKETSHELENLIDDIRTDILVKGEPGSSCETQQLSLILAAKVEPKIRELLAKVEGILNQKDVLGLRKGARNSEFRSLPCPLVEECDILGRNFDKNCIVKWLLSNECNTKIGVLPIVGMAGIGKTTLARLIYSDDRVKEHFDIIAWVHVSHKFDEFKVLKTLFDSLVNSEKKDLGNKCYYNKEPYDINEFYQLQVYLKCSLASKKFLFVLDDVWNENHDKWDCLKSYFESAARESKIVITTRSEVVASKMGTTTSYHLQALSNDDCWTLFAKHAFNNAQNSREHPNLEAIGRQIIAKCNNLPLAVKSLSGLLRSELNPEKWNILLKSDIWKLSERESNIIPAFWLSYYYLPPHIKRCFAYCSVLSRHCQFEKKKLIWMWIGEDLLQPEKGKKIEEVGEDYFEHLVARSLIQRLGDSDDFIMHGLVNDLAKFVSGNFSCRLEHDEFGGIGSSSTLHLSYEKRNIDSVMKYMEFAEMTSLRTFLPLGHSKASEELVWNESILDKLLSSAKYLRVLSLSSYPIIELPSSIGKSKHLRYLDLSETHLTLLPEGICHLYNLQILLLKSCKNLTQLPVDIGRLVRLRHLDITGTKITEMPAGMSNMKDLQTLTDFILGKESGSNIKELKELNQLSGTLRIGGIENIQKIEDVLEANLKDKEYLSDITFTSIGYIDDSQFEREKFDGFQPHNNLEGLKIKGYAGTYLPDWIGDLQFSNMVRVVLKNCYNCCSMPPLGQLPSLKVLEVSHFPMVTRISDEFYLDASQPFRCLETLSFSDMPGWQEWKLPRAEGEHFPSLRELCLSNCPKLTGKLPSKRVNSLKIVDCGSLSESCFA